MAPAGGPRGAGRGGAYAQLRAAASAEEGSAAAPRGGCRGSSPPASGRRSVALRSALATGLLVAATTAAWLAGQSRHLRRMRRGGLELKAEDGPTWVQEFSTQCQKLEVDVEYVNDAADAWGTNYDHIPTPEMCCAMCQGVPRCNAFTWVKDAGLEGCPSQCWLKSGGQGTPRPKRGVVSGVPPPRRVLPPVPSGVGGPGGTLYCYSLVVPTSYEPGMLKWQFEHKASIFACDGYGVYSNKRITIAPGVESILVDSDLKCEYGGDSGTALNAWIFIAVWKSVIDDGSYKNFDWVVKCDPDAVFFPDRLGMILKDHPKKGYINNCKYGMHGPIEVFSSDAINILAIDYARSWDGKAPKTCVSGQDFGLWGEDMFMDQCLQKVLKVQPRPLEPRLMCEAHCDCPAWYWCTNGTDRVSFHPFKSPEAYAVCMANALDGKPGSVLPSASLPPRASAPAQETARTAKHATARTSGSEDAEDGPGPRAAAAGDCEDVVASGGGRASGHPACAKAVRWAKEHGVFEHPEWYEDAGIGPGSSYAAFQQFLFEGGEVGCPRPCADAGGKASAGQASAGEASAGEASAGEASAAPSPPGKQYPKGPRAQTFYMYRAQSKASYPMENINTADLAGVMWYLHNEVVSATPRKYHIDRIKRFKVTVKNTWEFWNAHKRQFGAFMAFDAARCSTPVCDKVYDRYGFIVGCQVCDVKVANYLAKSQTNWNCEKGSDLCRAPLWYSLPGPCPSMGMSNEEIDPNKVGLNVMEAKTPECIRRMPGGHCDKATGAPDCTYSYEEAGEIMLNDLVGIPDYNEFWNTSFTECANKVAEGKLPYDTRCLHQKEYDPETDKGVGMTFWDGIHDEEMCTRRMDAVRQLFKAKFPQFPESLDEPPCEFDMYYDGEFDWKVDHSGAPPSSFWDNKME